MSIKDIYSVESIPKHETHDWLLKKHYAKRIPIILKCFGLYHIEKGLMGVCTFGPPPIEWNDPKVLFNNNVNEKINMFELNRLVVNENLEKNVLSFFVSSSLNFLKKPCVVLSYSDMTKNHHGYIYQATNWFYTGSIAKREVFINNHTGKEEHPRSIYGIFGTSSKEDSQIKKHYTIKKQEPKHRYFYFLGNKKIKKAMRKNIKYDVLPYPKGNNQRYDASYKPQTQTKLF